MIAPSIAAKLLEDVIYARVLECVDLEKLMMIEVDLWVALCERCEVASADADDRARDEAKAMIDRALDRLAKDPERFAPLQPFGMPCGLCDDEARAPLGPQAARADMARERDSARAAQKRQS